MLTPTSTITLHNGREYRLGWCRDNYSAEHGKCLGYGYTAAEAVLKCEAHVEHVLAAAPGAESHSESEAYRERAALRASPAFALALHEALQVRLHDLANHCLEALISIQRNQRDPAKNTLEWARVELCRAYLKAQGVPPEKWPENLLAPDLQPHAAHPQDLLA